MVPEQKEVEFVFPDIAEKPVPSLLRGFSAPIRLESDLTDNDYYFLLANDSDEFNRYAIYKSIFLPPRVLCSENLFTLLVLQLGSWSSIV